MNAVISENEPTFAIGGKSWKTTGRLTEDGFLVFAGSTVNAVTESFKRECSYYPIRLELEKTGIITDGIFVKDYIFKSPCQAGSIAACHACSANTEWRTDDEDKTPFGVVHPKAKRGERRDFSKPQKVEKRDDTPPMGYTVMDDGTPRYVIPSNEGGYIEFRGNEAKRRAEAAHASSPGVIMEVSVAND